MKVCAAGGNAEIRWIVDSGSAADLVEEGAVNLDHAVTSSQPLVLCTANGTVISETSVQVQLASIGMNVEANLLPNTPAVCSLGKRCMEDGCGFIWAPRKNPIFRCPDGHSVVLDLHYNVPYITEKQASCIARHMPSVPAGGSSSSKAKPADENRKVAAESAEAVFRRASRKAPVGK